MDNLGFALWFSSFLSHHKNEDIFESQLFPTFFPDIQIDSRCRIPSKEEYEVIPVLLGGDKHFCLTFHNSKNIPVKYLTIFYFNTLDYWTVLLILRMSFRIWFSKFHHMFSHFKVAINIQKTWLIYQFGMVYLCVQVKILSFSCFGVSWT